MTNSPQPEHIRDALQFIDDTLTELRLNGVVFLKEALNAQPNGPYKIIFINPMAPQVSAIGECLSIFKGYGISFYATSLDTRIFWLIDENLVVPERTQYDYQTDIVSAEYLRARRALRTRACEYRADVLQALSRVYEHLAGLSSRGIEISFEPVQSSTHTSSDRLPSRLWQRVRFPLDESIRDDVFAAGSRLRKQGICFDTVMNSSGYYWELDYSFHMERARHMERAVKIQAMLAAKSNENALISGVI